MKKIVIMSREQGPGQMLLPFVETFFLSVKSVLFFRSRMHLMVVRENRKS